MLEKRTIASHRFNNIKTWMLTKLAERDMSISGFELATGNKITKASILRWFSGEFLPKRQSLILVCETLSKLPIVEEGKPPRYEKVELAEAASQFSKEHARDQRW